MHYFFSAADSWSFKQNNKGSSRTGCYNSEDKEAPFPNSWDSCWFFHVI